MNFGDLIKICLHYSGNLRCWTNVPSMISDKLRKQKHGYL